MQAKKLTSPCWIGKSSGILSNMINKTNISEGYRGRAKISKDFCTAYPRIMERLNIVYECLNRCVRLQSYPANGWLNCLSEQKKEASYLPAILTEQVSSIIKDLLYDQITVSFF